MGRNVTKSVGRMVTYMFSCNFCFVSGAKCSFAMCKIDREDKFFQLFKKIFSTELADNIVQRGQT